MLRIVKSNRIFWFENFINRRISRAKKNVVWEYRCPKCGYVNRRPYEARRVVCDACGHEFIPDKMGKWVRW